MTPGQEMRALAARAAGALSDMPATVTVTVPEVAAILGEGRLAVLILPPRRRWETYHDEDREWTAFVVSPITSDTVAALDEVDAALDALRDALALDLDEAEPAPWENNQGHPFTGYMARFTT